MHEKRGQMIMKKEEWINGIEKYDQLSREISESLWNHPEVAGEEKASSELFRKTLAEHGFQITEVPGMPYAFCAEYGSGSPVIALLGEYDALPNMSQKLCTTRDEVEKGGNGHGCGHNLLGVASLCAALNIKDQMEKEQLSGTIRFYGCPEEETLVGKVKMIKAGAFEGCDLALSWHPMSVNEVYHSCYLANNSIKFKFHGTASHAGVAPQLGRSALDAVELMNVGANYLREHVIEKAKIHYTTNSGGFLPNIVPPYADSWYYVRAPKRKDVVEITERLINVAKGAALMAGVTLEIEKISGCYEMLINPVLDELNYNNMQEIEAPKFTEEEKQYAQELQDTVSRMQLDGELANAGLPQDYPQALHDGVIDSEAAKQSSLTASSDTGDVSYNMPMQVFSTACWPLGCTAHSWQATATVGGSIGHKGSIYASQIFTGMVYDLLTKPELVEQAKEAFLQQTKDAPYQCPLDE
jgi:aminobenzoyl-glutamate utilization protein B